GRDFRDPLGSTGRGTGPRHRAKSRRRRLIRQIACALLPSLPGAWRVRAGLGRALVLPWEPLRQRQGDPGSPSVAGGGCGYSPRRTQLRVPAIDGDGSDHERGSGRRVRWRRSPPEDVSIGKFDILATYAYAKGLLDGLPDDEARERGMVAAVMGAKARLGHGS